MSNYEKHIQEDGKTIWLPISQTAQPRPKQAMNPKKQIATKRIGKKFGERKNWW